MIDQYVLASNDDGDLAIRTVQATESSSVTDTTSVITATDDGKLAVRVVGAGGGGGGDQHNLGWYATEAALESAHPTANDGDWAIVGSTDTVWVWDSDSTGWKDTGQAGIELPDQTGHSGEFLTTDGTDASWSDTTNPINIKMQHVIYSAGIIFKGVGNNNNIFQLNMSPNSGRIEFDIRNNSDTRTGYYYLDSAISPALSSYTLGKSTNKWDNVYTTKLNNGADIAVPTTGGTMAVIGVNTTVTLTAAGWSSNTQTVTVTGMTATGVVLVSPDPTDQAAYTSAGIICTAQAADSLTFTCSTTPTADINVNVVML